MLFFQSKLSLPYVLMTVQLQRYELYKFVFNLMVILSSMIWEYSKIIVF